MSKNNLYQEVEKIKVKAVKQHGDFVSMHEGYAVILEEVDELWDEVRRKKPNIKNSKTECLQIAAMAVKMHEFLEKMEKKK